MTFPPKFKPWSQRPMDHNGGDQTSQWMDWATNAINQLAGQAAPPAQTGLQSLITNTIDPTTSQIVSSGNRVASVITEILFDAGAGGSTSVKFAWDGVTLGSQVFAIARDDGTIQRNPGNVIGQSPLTVTGLVTATTYFFYPYFDELLQQILFYTDSNATGSPPIAFLSQSLKGAQAQIMKNRLQLGILVATTGIKTGGGTGSGGQGGGGAGGGRGGKGPLQ